MSSTVTSRRRQLGNEIRRARLAAGMTQQEVAELLGCGQGKINKIETGAVSVKQSDLKLMLDAFGASRTEVDMMTDLARASVQRGQWSGYRSAVPHWFRTFTDLEPAASEILSWHGERIPGPLQSEHYMLKQFGEARATDVTSLVRNRLERKQVFDLKRPPYYRFILGEAAFRRMPGGPNPSVALDQVQHLIELEKTYPRTFIHVLPFDTRLAYVPNDFTIMRFSDTTKDFVFVEHAAGGIYIDDEGDFELFVDNWDRLRGVALERAETGEFLEKLAQDFRAQMQV
ncbi:helix-turn-helix domain-containing protein [Kutzneria sp. CA-103260]|uniref:helix-turn-helix domain-containing protein n=1 Tax=Kutzneria sp. CA-103260 TaxID=2802641 RepID=UPI001BA70DDA|nr:helix-turn-helix transcriptional regulator [Kutzneria sp. CA-103260]QUQ64420.1 XRE family transcriptional regulator [Kutzneria sp. CA-103260]